MLGEHFVEQGCLVHIWWGFSCNHPKGGNLTKCFLHIFQNCLLPSFDIFFKWFFSTGVQLHSSKIHTWPQGRTASCSSFPVDTVPLPDFSFYPPVQLEDSAVVMYSGFGGALFHNRHELLFPQIPCWVNTRYNMYEWPVSLVKNLLAFVKVSISISPNGSFAGFHWACVTWPFQGNINCGHVRVSGVITLQFTSCEWTDSSTRSNKVEVPELLKWVGWRMTCVST